MDIEKLNKANELNRRIREFTEALNCFEWENGGQTFSTNPRLIIQFHGGDGREELPIPMELSDVLVGILKAEIKSQRSVCKMEFDKL